MYNIQHQHCQGFPEGLVTNHKFKLNKEKITVSDTPILYQQYSFHNNGHQIEECIFYLGDYHEEPVKYVDYTKETNNFVNQPDVVSNYRAYHRFYTRSYPKSTPEYRKLAIERYKEKRCRRKYKVIRYENRKIYAQKRQRENGRFVKSVKQVVEKDQNVPKKRVKIEENLKNK